MKNVAIWLILFPCSEGEFDHRRHHLKENIVIANHAFMRNMTNLLKSAYLLHQLLCAMRIQNVITGQSKDNELKKKGQPSERSTIPRVSLVMCNLHCFCRINNPVDFLKLY